MPFEFHGVKSDAFKIEEEWIYVFVYGSEHERKKGIEEYNVKSKQIEGWLPRKTYEVKNVFVLYLKEKEDLDNEIKEAMRSLEK